MAAVSAGEEGGGGLGVTAPKENLCTRAWVCVGVFSQLSQVL